MSRDAQNNVVCFSGRVHGPGRAAGLPDGDPEHLHQAGGPAAGAPQICLPRQQRGRGPRLQVGQFDAWDLGRNS